MKRLLSGLRWLGWQSLSLFGTSAFAMICFLTPGYSDWLQFNRSGALMVAAAVFVEMSMLQRDMVQANVIEKSFDDMDELNLEITDDHPSAQDHDANIRTFHTNRHFDDEIKFAAYCVAFFGTFVWAYGDIVSVIFFGVN